MRAHKGPLLSSINLFYSFFLPVFFTAGPKAHRIKIPFSLTFVKISRQKEPAGIRLCRKLQADAKGMIDFLQYFRIQMAYFIFQSSFVNGTQLLQ